MRADGSSMPGDPDAPPAGSRWVTETVNSAARLYYETREQPLQLSPTNRVEVPVAMAVFPKEIPIPPRSLAERGYNILLWTVMGRGGHFAVMEQPGLLAISENSSVRCARGFTASGWSATLPLGLIQACP